MYPGTKHVHAPCTNSYIYIYTVRSPIQSIDKARVTTYFRLPMPTLGCTGTYRYLTAHRTNKIYEFISCFLFLVLCFMRSKICPTGTKTVVVHCSCRRAVIYFLCLITIAPLESWKGIFHSCVPQFHSHFSTLHTNQFLYINKRDVYFIRGVFKISNHKGSSLGRQFQHASRRWRTNDFYRNEAFTMAVSAPSQSSIK